MAFFKKLFTKKKKKGGVNETIQKQRNLITLLEKRDSVLDKRINDEVVKAKDLIKKKQKPAALQCLKRKKMLVASKGKILAQINNIEALNMKLEAATLDADVFLAQKQAAEEIKKIHKKLGDIDELADMMDDIKSVLVDIDEVSNILSQDITGMGDALDDADLNDEFADLQDEVNGEKDKDKDMDDLKNLDVPDDKIEDDADVKNELEELMALVNA